MAENTQTPDMALPPVGWSIVSTERILGLAPKTGYRAIRQGKLKAFVGLDGRLYVHPYSVWKYLEENE